MRITKQRANTRKKVFIFASREQEKQDRFASVAIISVSIGSASCKFNPAMDYVSVPANLGSIAQNQFRGEKILE